jgi:hypothetical protein
VRRKTIFICAFNPMMRMAHASANFSLSLYRKLCYLRASRLVEEGRFAIVTDVEAGSGGRIGSQRVFLRGRTIGAHGQAVWFWHLGADAKLATTYCG